MSVPSTPLVTTSRNPSIDGHRRLFCPTPIGTPARRHASTARAASLRLSDSGFSHMTGLPASATRTIWSACSECGVASTTAFTCGSFRTASSSVLSRKPCFSATGRAASTSLLTPCTKRSFSVLPCTACTMFLPHHPSPTIAASIITSPLKLNPRVIHSSELRLKTDRFDHPFDASEFGLLHFLEFRGRSRHRLCTVLLVALAQLVRPEKSVRVAVDFADDILRQPGRSQQSEVRLRRESREAGLGHCGNLRQRDRPRPAATCERLELAISQRRHGRGQGEQIVVDAPAVHLRERITEQLERHVHRFQPGRCVEHLTGKMRGTAHAGRAVVEIAGLLFYLGNQFAERIDGQSRADDRHVRHRRATADVRE